MISKVLNSPSKLPIEHFLYFKGLHPVVCQKKRVFCIFFFRSGILCYKKVNIMHIYRIQCTIIIGDLFRNVLGSLGSLADLQEDIRNMVSGGEEDFCA